MASSESDEEEGSGDGLDGEVDMLVSVESSSGLRCRTLEDWRRPGKERSWRAPGGSQKLWEATVDERAVRTGVGGDVPEEEPLLAVTCKDKASKLGFAREKKRKRRASAGPEPSGWAKFSQKTHEFRCSSSLRRNKKEICYRNLYEPCAPVLERPRNNQEI